MHAEIWPSGELSIRAGGAGLCTMGVEAIYSTDYRNSWRQSLDNGKV